MIDVKALTDALEDGGFNPEPYSGRCMFGVQCVSIIIESEAELWELAYDLADQGIKIPAPRLDNMGRQLVAYWPSAKIEESA